MSTTPGQEPSETDQLLIRLRKDFSTFKPPSKFRKEIIAAMNSKVPKKELTEAIRVIMDKHGYGKLETTEIDKLFGYEPESETKLADPIKPPVTTPADPAAVPFSITTFCLIYDVKSTDPIYQTVAIQDEGDGKNPKITCVVDLKTEPKTYALTLEREAKTGHYWVSWTTPDTTVWRVRLYSQWQGGKIVRYFKGVFLPAGGGDPVDFFGEEKPIEVEDEDREPGWWATYGPWVGVGAIVSIGPITGIVHAILSYRHNKSKEAADKLKDEAIALEGKKDLAKKKALAEMDAVEKFFESTSEPRREQLLTEIKQAATAEFHEMIDSQKIAQDRWNGGDLKFEFNGQDKPMREAFDKIVKDKIAEWVPMNPIVSITQINQEMVDKGYLSQAELQEMDTAVREKATKRLDRTFTDPYGNYRPLVDATLEAMRVELNANTLTARVNSAQTEINLNNVVINVLETNLKNLKSDVDTAAAKIKELDKDKNQQDYATKRDHWEKLIQTTNHDIQKNVDEQKIREQEKTAAKDKYEDVKKKKDAMEKEKKKADKARIDREKRFKERIKIGF